jgi:hypothetical protein
MSEITYNGDVEMKIRQVHYMGEFTGWEGELLVKGHTYCEGTAPTFWGVHDLLTEYIWEQTVKDDHPVLDHNWFTKDANDRGKD